MEWGSLRAFGEALEKAKASVRAPDEHVFDVLKCR
jgi:hypothetical protein